MWELYNKYNTRLKTVYRSTIGPISEYTKVLFAKNFSIKHMHKGDVYCVVNIYFYNTWKLFIYFHERVKQITGVGVAFVSSPRNEFWSKILFTHVGNMVRASSITVRVLPEFASIDCAAHLSYDR